MKFTACFFLLLAAFFSSTAQGQVNIYLSPSGNDNNNGSLLKPYATFDAAIEQVIKSPANSSVTIYLRQGYYALTKSVLIDSVITGGRKLTISNYRKEKVIISGGVELDKTKIHRLEDKVSVDRLPGVAKKNVYYTDLDEQKINDLGNFSSFGFGRVVNSPIEFFFNDQQLIPARWPKVTSVPIGKVIDGGSITRYGKKPERGAKFNYDFDRPSYWKNDKNIWVYGLFAYGYADDNIRVDSIDTKNKIITLAQGSYYGVRASSRKDEQHPFDRGYYFYNVLEELDEPGECYLNTESRRLYFWPPSDITTAKISASILETPLFILYHLKNVSIKGISFAYGRNMGIYIAGTDHLSIEDCTFSNFGTKAISTSDPVSYFKVDYHNKKASPDRSENHFLTIKNCAIYNTGSGAIVLTGGNRKELISANNILTDCIIHNYSRRNRSAPPAIVLHGVGNKVSHCYIYDASSAAINFTGNDHIISYNHIRNVATDFSDIGAVYTGRDPSSTGTKIYNNFFDSILSYRNDAVAAVYIDDGSGGIIVSENIFYKCGNLNEYGAIHINGGANNKFDNNYFIECPKVISNTVWDDKSWHRNMTQPEMLAKLTQDVDIRSEKYILAYPYLKDFFDSSGARAPQLNYLTNSLLYRVNTITAGNTSFKVTDTYTLNDSSSFLNFDKKNFTIESKPNQLKNLSGWKPIAFEKIGPGK